MIGIPLLTIVGLLVISEFVFRALIFSDLPYMWRFRNPSMYANYFSDDEYWLLYHRFDGKYQPPTHPHPILGWVGSFDTDTFIHNEASRVGKRRPVLLYGDSFAACNEKPCFQDVLNNDPAFSKKCYLLNNGVGGYGLDQIYLLMRQSIQKYNNPLVIFSLLTEDIDRTILSVRIGQKPRFILQDGKLRLAGIPINDNASDFFEKTRPQVNSYLFQMGLHGKVFPNWVASTLNREGVKRNEKITLTRAILKEAIADLRENGIEFLFLVFVGNWKGESSIMEDRDWRLDTIVQVIKDENVNYINAKDVLRADMAETGRTVEEYFIPGDGHYNGYANTVVAGRLKTALGMCGS